MKRFLITLAIILMVGCKSALSGVSTEGLTHQGESIYYNGAEAAKLSAIEVAYDDGKIVRELTFIITDARYNDKALSIIKFMREHNTNTEVEVELKRK